MNVDPVGNGVSLAPIAEYFDARGWQLVPTQWHRNKDKLADTPMTGVTGSAPFLTVDALDQLVDVGWLRLHREGGPECVAQFAKTALRPPVTVVGFDVDDGYAGKSGGDSIVAAEMQLGPLPGTWSCTARGPDTPSRRRWFRKPADLLVMDRFFTPYGGFIETIRTGHRYSWAPPAIHVRKGQVVGPVVWYGPDGRPSDMPHVDQLGELPAPWVQAIWEDNAKYVRSQVNRDGVGAGGSTPITPSHADSIVLKLIRNLHELPPAGGQFRSAVFGLAAAISRRTVAQGGEPEDVHDEMAEVFAEHPCSLQVDEDDAKWIEEGIARGWSEPWVFIPEEFRMPTVQEFMSGAPGTGRLIPVSQIAPAYQPALSTSATEAEFASFIASFTCYRNPRALGRRLDWMCNDGPAQLPRHAYAVVQEVISGLYPADRALSALGVALQHHQHTDPAAPRILLAFALGAVLTEKVS